MIHRFHQWLTDCFLPRYAHYVQLEELERTREELRRVRERFALEEQYAAGLAYALRHGCHITMTIQGADTDANTGA